MVAMIVAPASLIAEVALEAAPTQTSDGSSYASCANEAREIPLMQSHIIRTGNGWFLGLLGLFFVLEFAQFFRKYRKAITLSRQDENPDKKACETKTTTKEQSEKAMNSLLHKVCVTVKRRKKAFSSSLVVSKLTFLSPALL